MLKTFLGAVALAATVAAHAQRIEHVGPVAHSETAVSSVDMRTDLMTAARTIFPPSWNGFAQKGLDVRRASALRMQGGEPWLVALDRWLAQEQLSARLDWSARSFYLRSGTAVAGGASGGEVSRNWAILTSDVRLETTLERWAREGGYRLVWDADRHILISAADQFSGTISAAINRVLNSPAIRDSDYPLEAVFYANQPPVIRITRLGDQPSKD